jgi:hypothetical protein
MPVGRGDAPSPATDGVTANTSVDGVTKTATGAKDALGNAQSAGGSVVVKLDKTDPGITAAQTKNTDGTTTITFTCSDAPSGISSCLADGSSTTAGRLLRGDRGRQGHRPGGQRRYGELDRSCGRHHRAYAVRRSDDSAKRHQRLVHG